MKWTREAWLWIAAIAAFIVLGILLDLLWGAV